MPGFVDDDQNQAPEFATPSAYKPRGANRQVIGLNAKDHPDYRLMFHAMRWGWFGSDGGGEWLPILRRLPLSPGTNNVDKDGSPALAFAIEGAEGWIAIQPEAVPGQPYIVEYEGIGGTIHLSPWHKLKQIGNQVLQSTDDVGYRAWLRALCSQMGWKPDADVLMLKRAEFEREYADDSARAAQDSKAKARAEGMRKMLDGMDADSTKRKATGRKPAKGTPNE